MRLPHRVQIGVSFGLLLLTELCYRIYNPEDPYNNGQSLGSWTDMLFMGKINDGGWVTVNFLPTAAHTIWGVICGQMLLARTESPKVIKSFLMGGVTLLLLGYALDVLHITPIIKRIATTSFTLASGGWAILTLTLFYWLIDVKGLKSRWLRIFSVVGTNSIFIYLFAETLGVQWFRDFGKIFTMGILAPLGISVDVINVINALFVLFIFWYITYFLDQKKVYFKV